MGIAGQWTLTRWLLKQAIVQEFVIPQTSELRISTTAQRRTIKSGGIPEGWRMAIGAFEGVASLGVQHRIGRAKIHIDDVGTLLGRCALHTFRFECFVGQVLVHSCIEPPRVQQLLGGPGFAEELLAEPLLFWPPRATFSPDSIQTVEEFQPQEVA